MQTLAVLVLVGCTIGLLIAVGGWCCDLMNGRRP